MGAVSVSYVSRTPRVLSVTTAPGLNPDQMSIYVDEIHSFMENDGQARDPGQKKKNKERRLASPELIRRLYTSLRSVSPEKAEKVLKSLEGE